MFRGKMWKNSHLLKIEFGSDESIKMIETTAVQFTIVMLLLILKVVYD